MRITHVVRQFAPGYGGLENHVSGLGREQVSAGDQVSVVTLDRIFDGAAGALPAQETIAGIEVARVPFGGSRRYPIAPGVLRHLRDADVVHVHGVDFFADYLAHTGFVHRKPLVLSTHGGFFHTKTAGRFKRWYFDHVTRRSLQAYGAVVACSTSDADLFRPICADRLVTIENGVDLDRFAGVVPSGDKTIVAFGRLAPNKEPATLLRWFAAVHALDPAWRLILAGKPMGVDPENLARLAAQLGIAHAVDLHLTPTDDALRALAARATIFASSSSHEGFGLAVVEAASAGLYPVLSDIPAHRRSCERLGYGRLLDFTGKESATAFVDAFAAGELQTPPPAKRAGALASFGLPAFAGAIRTVYADVLGEERRWFGGIAVRPMQVPEAVSQLQTMVTQRSPQVIAFCNSHTVNTARDDDGLASQLSGAFVLNDGVGLDIASWLRYGRGFPANLNGTDLVPAFLGSLTRKVRLYLVGSAPGIAARAGRMLARRLPQVELVGADHGFFDPEDEPDLRERIRAARPDLVMVGMGQPRQEYWATRNVDALGVPVLCVGGLIDFTAGATIRAPAWARAARLEWIHRLASEPRRLARRYIVGNVRFLAAAVVEAARGVPHVVPEAPRTPLSIVNDAR